MRRAEREITETGELLALVDQCKVCRLGLSENNQAYIVPLNFGYTFEGGTLTLYFHSAHEGRKIDILKQNPRACFEVDCQHRLLTADTACGHSFAFASVVGFGTVEFIDTAAEKTRALDLLMQHQTGTAACHQYSEAQLSAVTVYKLTVSEFTGKRHAPPPQVHAPQ